MLTLPALRVVARPRDVTASPAARAARTGAASRLLRVAGRVPVVQAEREHEP